MSSDLAEKTLVALAKALRVAKLEAIVIGNSASMLNGAPVTTQDIDLLIRDTKPNRRKLGRFADEIGGSSPMPVSELRKVADTCACLRPQLPQMDPGDLSLIVRCLLLPPARRAVFLARRKDGRYVF